MLSCVIRQAYVVLFTRDTLGITLLHNSTPSETSFKGEKNTTGLCYHPCCWNMPAQRMRMPRARFVETITTSHYSCKREYTRRARSGCVHGAGRSHSEYAWRSTGQPYDEQHSVTQKAKNSSLFGPTHIAICTCAMMCDADSRMSWIKIVREPLASWARRRSRWKAITGTSSSCSTRCSQETIQILHNIS